MSEVKFQAVMEAKFWHFVRMAMEAGLTPEQAAEMLHASTVVETEEEFQVVVQRIMDARP
jgi:hypothetical protein